MSTAPQTEPSQESLLAHLNYLRLPHIRCNYRLPEKDFGKCKSAFG
jgi:hypothetical protein